LITLPSTLFLCNVWIVPEKLVAQVKTKVQAAENCLGNAVVTEESSKEQDANLQGAV